MKLPDFSPPQAYDEFWMRLALELADKARSYGEVPIGAVLVTNQAAAFCNSSDILSTGYNYSISSCDATAHAEIMALREAGHRLQNYRLPETTLYVTIEPCAMCLGALIHARVSRLVYGATEPRAGAVDSNFQLTRQRAFNHRPTITSGVLAEPCGSLMQNFFKTKRKQRKLREKPQ